MPSVGCANELKKHFLDIAHDAPFAGHLGIKKTGVSVASKFN